MDGTKQNSKRKCINCGKVMRQQFLGLKHCKCGISWKKDTGYFERTSNMIFSLERRKKGEDGSKTKQVPIINKKSMDSD